MRDRRSIKGWAVACALVAGLVWAGENALTPELALHDLGGRPCRLSDYRGKIVVLNFWATWCGPCEDEMPLLRRVQKEYAERGVVVVAASLDEDAGQAQVARFVKRKKIQFPIWVGATTDHLKAFDLGEALPATAFIDAEGHVVGRVLGQLRAQDLRPRLDWMLGERRGRPPEPLVNNLD